MRRRVLVAALAVTLAAGAAACGDDDDGGSGGESVPSTIDPKSTTTAPSPEDLPPAGALDLVPLYGDALAEIGLQLTDRGGLIDRSGGGYVASPTGTHLALYVEPIDDRTTPQFIAGIRDVALIFSDIYDRWPGLQSYDVCQEPTDPDGTQGPEPLPVTQIEITRAEADAIEWDDVTVVDLVRASLASPPELRLRVSSELAADPEYMAILEEAEPASTAG